MIIAIDFDGTVVKHEYPEIGEERPFCVDVLKRLCKVHSLILLTMRSGKTLQEAVDWFKTRDIRLWGVNENPEQHTWTDSRKVYAHLYIDDAALGCPLDKNGSVDWYAVEKILIDRKLL